MPRLAGATLLLFLILGAAPSPGQTTAPATVGVSSTQSAHPTLADLGFLRGCWRGSFESPRGAGTIEEFYTSPSANIMLGTTRYIRGARTVQFEFSLIAADSLGILLRPYPGGQASADDFRLTSLEGGRAVFESPEHDYPKRIHYWTEADGTRVARIDGGGDDPGGSEWRMRRVACPDVGS